MATTQRQTRQAISEMVAAPGGALPARTSSQQSRRRCQLIPENDPDIVRKTLELQQKCVAEQKAARAKNGTAGPQPRDLEKPMVLMPTSKPDFPIIDWNSLE